MCLVNELRETRRCYAYSKIAEQNPLFSSRNSIEMQRHEMATNGHHMVVWMLRRKLGF
jgi:hypothetical protein